MTGVYLAIKVQQLLLGPDAEEQGLYCVLSTGNCRFSTTKTQAAADTFILSPWELSHADHKPLPAPASASSTTKDQSPLGTGTSPVLTVELYSAKRWGADSVLASAELLLVPYLQDLQPNTQGLQVRLVLTKPNSKSGGRALAKSASGVGGGAAAGNEAAGFPEALIVVLQLSTVLAPATPVGLLGPVGSGRAEVPPRLCTDARWLSPQRPVLHTSAGQVYQTPSVQLIRVTLHRALGLQNLHVDPLAAAAAAAVINKMASARTSSSPSRADRALAAAEKMLDGTKAGRQLLKQTSSWFARSKSSIAAATAPAAASKGASLLHSSSTGGVTPAAVAAVEATAAGKAASPTVTRQASGLDGKLDSPKAAAAAALGTTQSAAHSPKKDLLADKSTGTAADLAAGLHPKGGSSSLAAAVDPAETHPVGDSPRGLRAGPSGGASSSNSSPVAPNPYGAAGLFEETAAAMEDTAATLEEAVTDTFSNPGGSGPSFLADPVSKLKQATQHTRTTSVDTEAVNAALEENGFHATDAPGGAFFYARISLVTGTEAGSSGTSNSSSSTGSSSYISRVVGLGPGGEAKWEQGFWLPVVRPAPPAAALELELFAAKDDKTRGKSVASVRTPLHQLLQQQHGAEDGPDAEQLASSSRSSSDSSSSDKAPQWLRTTHELLASFSDHLHCTLSITVEAADWDLRAELAGLPRVVITPAPAAETDASSAAVASRAEATAPGNKLVVADGALAQSGSPRSLGPAAAAAATAGSPSNSRPASVTSGSSLVNAGSVASLASIAAEQSALVNAGEAVAAAGTGANSASVARQPPPPVADLDLVVKAFDIRNERRHLDVFFVLLLGPYCVVSSTSHSTHHHHWGWHLKFPVGEPADLLTLALFAREDQAGGRKRVGAAMLTMFSSSIKLVGKLRVRLSTLPANTPVNVSMPLQGERSNLRAGQESAATAHIYFNLTVPQLLGRYLPAYARFTACSPALYLLAVSPEAAGPDSSLEALGSEVQQTTARWLEQQPPMLPAKVYRKVQDEGRVEFTLSRTRSNWRRLMLLRDATAPARAAFTHLCSWDNTWHSAGWYCVILLFGVFPSKVLSVLLLLLAVALARAALTPPKGSPSPTAAAPGTAAAVHATSVAASTTAATGTAAAGGGSSSSSSWHLLPNRPPPPMWDPGYISAEESQIGTAVPTDPYTSLKQNYEAVIGFLTAVQNVLDNWAAAGERIQFAFSWTDQLATGILLMLMVLLALGLWVLGLQVLVTVGLLWVFRHPILRNPLPPPPVNFVSRLPTRSDTML